ncbi:oxidoreductase [Streptomyces viridochromogenes]|uniref:Oxidoreductase n=1 Tax=Streptomyces viridochromogenes TaxID=1938 RepID=A0A0J7ZC28_STRVR|nr:LLM class F420-dependent oxidoreductase [Streptomyces viridochromogenes]KMS73389.1 oxidoreductase [Streptomyces viridochromogenes]KOG25452.1 oxidoreductase [Streptomyces viridochromogenes]KOG28255.1 oxidoreductase [Streptomyces viridochromogenes]
MDFSVVAVAREDDSPVEEPLRVAVVADRLGYREVWAGEGPTWDSFVLAAAIGRATERVALTAGPVAVSVREPFGIARGAASVAAVTGRPVGVALGTSSKRVVEGVHGVPRVRPAAAMDASAAALRVHLHGKPGEPIVPGSVFPRRLQPPGGPLTVAAFGDRAIATAAAHSDRMLLDIVSPEQVRTLRAKLTAAAERVGRTPPTLASWLPAAVDPDPESLAQVLRSIAGYLTVPGYSDMFEAAGFGEAVELARTGADPGTLVRALPAAAADMVGLVGDLDAVRARVVEYAEAGLDEIALVPATAGDPGGERTLTAFRQAW